MAQKHNKGKEDVLENKNRTVPQNIHFSCSHLQQAHKPRNSRVAAKTMAGSSEVCGGVSRPDLRRSLDWWCWLVAQLRPYMLFAISSVKHWLVSFGSLWTVQSPSILDVSLPSVSVFEQIDRLSFPRQWRVGGLIWLPGRINSCWKSVRFQGTTGHSRRKGKPISSLACVCSLQQRSLFLVKDYILFSLGYPQLKKKSPWWVN